MNRQTRRRDASRPHPTDPGSALQAANEELLDRAMRMPGVAEAIDVYGRFAPYAPGPVAGTIRVRHATGGNT
jgi:hypothetical protein